MNAAMPRATLAAAVLAMGLLLSLSTHVAAQSTAPKMYWVSPSTDDIKRANLDGTSIETLISSGLSDPRDIALDVTAGKMYWTESGSSDIKRANLDGTSVETLNTNANIPNSGFAGGLALDLTNSKMYWVSVQSSQWSIKAANLDGNSVETVVSTGGSAPTDIVLDVAASKVYWAIWGSSNIHSANLDGTSSTNWNAGGDGIYSLALDVNAAKVYWISSTIGRADLDGTSTETLVNFGSADNSRGIALDVNASKIYWKASSTISRVNLDGTSTETLISSGVTGVQGIAIAVLPNVPRVTVTSIGEDSIVLDWDDVEDATDYQYRYKMSTESAWSDPTTVSESPVLVTGLTAGTNYDFQVRGRESGVTNDWSSTVTARTSSTNPDISRLPAQVKGLSVVSQGTERRPAAVATPEQRTRLRGRSMAGRADT